MHCHARLGEQCNCDSIQVTINGATSRCQWACHQCLLNTLTSYVFWSPPIVVHHWGCRLASLHRGSCNPWCPRAPKPTCTCQRRGKHWDHSQGAGVSQQWSKGSHSMHSPALFAKRIFLVKRSDGGQLPRYGQQYPDVKGLQPAPIRRPAMRLDMAVFAWEHMMHEQAAYHWNAYKLQCFWGRIGETHIGVSREPQSLWPSWQRWQTRNHSTGRATDIFPG